MMYIENISTDSDADPIAYSNVTWMDIVAIRTFNPKQFQDVVSRTLLRDTDFVCLHLNHELFSYSNDQRINNVI